MNSLSCQDAEGFGPFSLVYYDLTWCFLKSLSIANSGFLLLGGAFKLSKLLSKKRIGYRRDWQLWARLITLVIQVFVFATFGYQFEAFALLISMIFHFVDYEKSTIPATTILLYWIFNTFISTFFLLNRYLRGEKYAVFVATICTSTMAISLQRHKRNPERGVILNDKSNPYDTADIISVLTFSWLTPLMQLGQEKVLGQEDLYRLPENYNTEFQGKQFEKYWKGNGSLFLAIIKLIFPKLALAALMKLLLDFATFAQPQLLKLLIMFVNDYVDAPEVIPIARGFVISLWIFTTSILQDNFQCHYFSLTFLFELTMVAGVSSSIYKKTLKISTQNVAASELVNLISVDLYKLQDLCIWGLFVWSIPLQISLCLISLYKLLGNAMWAGIIIMILAIPFNSIVAKHQARMQEHQMTYTDMRTRLTNEILTNMKSLKLYGWETPFKAKLATIRNDKELKNMKSLGFLKAFSNFEFRLIPFLVSCSSFAIFTLMNPEKPLTTELVFPALVLFNLLDYPLSLIPKVTTFVIDAYVANNKIHKYLTAEEIQINAINRFPTSEKHGVEINNGTFLWDDKTTALSKINFEAVPNEIHCVVGKIGSGKSTLIQALLGNLSKSEGTVSVFGSIAYVAQTPWIRNDTIKNNILFGHKFDSDFYDTTLKACALTLDLANFVNGDQTLVGEKGISLSGGQKARIALARAVYARADIYLLDDPLAAVDEHVASHIVKSVLGKEGLLSMTTRVLITNKISVLSIADKISLLENGIFTEEGSLADSKNLPNLSKLIDEFGTKKSITEFQDDQLDEELLELEKLDAENYCSQTKQRRASMATLTDIHFNDDQHEQEERETGRVKWDVYVDYIKACGPINIILMVMFIALSVLMSLLTNVWLKNWSAVNTEFGYNPHIWYYLGIYAALGLSSPFFVLLETIMTWIKCTVNGSVVLHSKMVDAIFSAPMSFFESTPIGRILNRFGGDINKVDTQIASTFESFFQYLFTVLCTILVLTYSTWQFIIVIVPLLFIYRYYHNFFAQSSRELRRLDSLTWSPIFSHFEETLNGMATIRGFAQQERFTHSFNCYENNMLSTYHPSIQTYRWNGVRLQFMGSLIIFSACLLCIWKLSLGQMSAGMVGLSISYALQVTESLAFIIRMFVEAEVQIIAVERIMQYTKIEPQADMIVPSHRPPVAWPQKGQIVFDNYCTKYKSSSDLVLKNINVTINPQEKIGIVGRTGAGKSSLAMSLFRIIEAESGRIVIDDIDISSIGLGDLRHRLSIIPQDAQMFEGTIRDNIDPTQTYHDTDIWKALELSHLKEYVMSAGDGSLNCEINLSTGQKQLLCLARAILIPSKILLLDEATAAVDVQTDAIVQETIRTAFADRTILTIAHRLNTILDSDKILVLDDGRVAEFDTPASLIADKETIFYSLCHQGGLV